MAHNRRSFLATLGGFFAAAATRKTWPALERGALPKSTKLDRIGIQLYTVRRQASADLAGVLASLAKIGYKEVEFAGYYNHSAAEIRDMLAANGLAAPSAHIGIEQLTSKPDQTFADAHTIGHQWITVASLPRGPHATTDDWKRVAEQFNEAGAKVKAAGFRFAFHNHIDIFKKTGDFLPADVVIRETDPALVSFEMDLYWAVASGADPIALLDRYPGRVTMLHIKDGRPPYTDASQSDVGAGTIAFAPILTRAKGIQHYFVESDSAADPLTFAGTSYAYLRTLEF